MKAKRKTRRPARSRPAAKSRRAVSTRRRAAAPPPRRAPLDLAPLAQAPIYDEGSWGE